MDCVCFICLNHLPRVKDVKESAIITVGKILKQSGGKLSAEDNHKSQVHCCAREGRGHQDVIVTPHATPTPYLGVQRLFLTLERPLNTFMACLKILLGEGIGFTAWIIPSIRCFHKLGKRGMAFREPHISTTARDHVHRYRWFRL